MYMCAMVSRAMSRFMFTLAGCLAHFRLIDLTALSQPPTLDQHKLTTSPCHTAGRPQCTLQHRYRYEQDLHLCLSVHLALWRRNIHLARRYMHNWFLCLSSKILQGGETIKKARHPLSSSGNTVQSRRPTKSTPRQMPHRQGSEATIPMNCRLNQPDRTATYCTVALIIMAGQQAASSAKADGTRTWCSPVASGLCQHDVVAVTQRDNGDGQTANVVAPYRIIAAGWHSRDLRCRNSWAPGLCASPSMGYGCWARGTSV